MNYLEFTSERRNRNEWEHPAEFEVEIMQSGTRESKVALDPVCNSYPIKEWNTSMSYLTGVLGVITVTCLGGNDIRNIDNRLYINNDSYSIIGPNYGPPIFGPILMQINGFYNGCLVTYNDGGGPGITRRILSYNIDIFNGEISIITDESFSRPLPYIGVFNLYISNVATESTGGNLYPSIWIPYSKNINNYYNYYYIQAKGYPDSARKIINYDGETHIAILESSTSPIDFNTPDFDELTPDLIQLRTLQMRKSTNYLIKNILYSNGLTLQYTYDSDLLSNNNINNFIICIPDLVNQQARGCPLNEPFSNTSYKIKNIQNYTFNYNRSLATIGVNYIELTEIISDIDYSGMIITLVTDQIFVDYAPAPYGYYNYVIDYYDKIVNRLYLTSILNYDYTTDIINSPIVFIRNITLFSSINYSFDNPLFFIMEVLPVSYDNYSPILYNGFNYNQESCFEISLIKLILPNKILINGGNVFQYPYMYVELNNMGTIYSNNTYSNKMLFRVIISDTRPPESILFVKLNGDGMIQTVKFKPNDKFKISVRLPNGDLFLTKEIDFYSPSPPNSEIQLSVLFSIKKL